jgi:hypothetical protein
MGVFGSMGRFWGSMGAGFVGLNKLLVIIGDLFSMMGCIKWYPNPIFFGWLQK